MRARPFRVLLPMLAVGLACLTARAEEDVIRIMVLPLHNTSGIQERDSWGSGVAELLYAQVHGTRSLLVLSLKETFCHLAALGKGLGECDHPDVAHSVADRAGVDCVIYGSLGGDATACDTVVRLRVLGDRRDTELFRGRITEEEVLDLSSRIAPVLLKALGRGGDSVDRARAGPAMSMQTWRHFNKSLEAFERALAGRYRLAQWTEVCELVTRAVREAPDCVELLLLQASCETMVATLSMNVHLPSSPGAGTLPVLDKNVSRRVLAIIDHVLQIKPDSVAAIESRAEARLMSGNIDGALADADDLVRRSVPSPVAHGIRAEASFAKGDAAVAVREMDQAVSLYPDAHLLCRRGVFRAQGGDISGALSDFEAALEIDPQDVFVYWDRATVLIEHHDFERALIDLDRAISDGPRYAFLYDVRGIAKVALRRYDDAIEDFQTAIRVDPDLGSAYNNLAAAHYRQGDCEAARSTVNEARARGLEKHLVPALLEALKEASGNDKVDEAIGMLLDASRPAPDREAAAHTLSKSGSPRAVAALVSGLQSKEKSVRAAAAAALGECKSPDAVLPLIHMLRNDSWDDVYQAKRALVAIGSSSVDPLLSAVRDGDAAFRRNACEIFGELHAAEALNFLLSEFDDGTWEAATALGQIGPPAVEALLQCLAKESPKLRRHAAYALAKTKDPRCVPALEDRLQDTDDDVRAEAAKSLALIPRSRSVDALLVALRDEAPDVRRAAAGALGEIDDERARGALDEAAQKKDFLIIAGAVRYFVRRGNPEEVPLLVEAVDQWDREVCGVLLDCGNEHLESAAKEWNAKQLLRAVVPIFDFQERDPRYPRWGAGR